MKKLFILGRNPDISLAEVESLYSADSISSIETHSALVEEPGTVNIDIMGGTVKIADLIGAVGINELDKVVKLLTAEDLWPESKLSGKHNLGVSLYGNVPLEPAKVTTELKKRFKKAVDGSIRTVPNKQADLSSGSVINNGLVKVKGCELILARHGDDILIAKTTAVQNLKRYQMRDRFDDLSDGKVGLLPSRLAQILLNLGLSDSSSDQKTVVLDPFCGNGIVLQEAIIRGNDCIGSDIASRMVDITSKRIELISRKFQPKGKVLNLTSLDATNANWDTFSAVVSELDLGDALTNYANEDRIVRLRQKADDLTLKFLINLRNQLSEGQYICLALPAWRRHKTDSNPIGLTVVDQLSDLGYNRVNFQSVSDQRLVYMRPDQYTAREIILIKSI